MKKGIINSIRYTIFFMIFYTMFDLINWKEVWANFNVIYYLKNIFLAIVVGSLMYLFDLLELNKKIIKKKKLNSSEIE
jgi:hypothetical protein